jgi:hypothetical protein
MLCNDWRAIVFWQDVKCMFAHYSNHEIVSLSKSLLNTRDNTFGWTSASYHHERFEFDAIQVLYWSYLRTWSSRHGACWLFANPWNICMICSATIIPFQVYYQKNLTSIVNKKSSNISLIVLIGKINIEHNVGVAIATNCCPNIKYDMIIVNNPD